jgi:hypothetical protein
MQFAEASVQAAPMGTDPSIVPANAVETADGGVQIVPGQQTPSTQEQPAADQRPAWLPEKFKTPEDMAKAYGELERKQGQPKAKEAPAPVVTESGLDLAALNSEYAENGALSDDTLTALEAKGYPRNMIEGYIAGQKALGQAFQATLAAEVGGSDALTSMLEWAGTNLSDAQVAAYNAAVQSGNADLAKLALHGLKASYDSANGSEPKLIQGEQMAAPGVKAFESTTQIVDAMRDPRYARDPEYRRQVEARVSASAVIG